MITTKDSISFMSIENIISLLNVSREGTTFHSRSPHNLTNHNIIVTIQHLILNPIRIRLSELSNLKLKIIQRISAIFN